MNQARHFADAYSQLLRSAILPAGDFLLGHPMMSRLRFLEQAQWWDRRRIAEYQRQELAQLLEVAYREVPFYQRLFDAGRMKPADVQTPADLTRLPVVTKQMLRAGYPHDTVRRNGARTYETSSSGSTGTNLTVREDHETAARYRAAFLLALGWAGWKIGEPHVQTGIMPERPGLRRVKDVLLGCRYVPVFDMTDPQLDATLDWLDSNSRRHLWGYPSSLYLLAQHARARGWNCKLDSIVTWGDNLYPHYKAEIESAFGCRILDTYGCGEGIQIAAQCGHGADYHICSLDTIVELLDDEGKPVAPGQTGHVVLTRLHPGPMPLIRYAVGDMAVRGGDGVCACGRGLELMGAIEGRDTDVVFTPNGNRLVVHFFTGIFEHFAEISQFQVIQREADLLLVRLVLLSDGEGFRARLLAKLRERGLADMRIQIEAVAEIPTAKSGKRRFIIRETPGRFLTAAAR